MSANGPRLQKQVLPISPYFEENRRFPLQSVKMYGPKHIVVNFKNTGNRYLYTLCEKDGKTIYKEILSGMEYPAKFIQCHFPYLVTLFVEPASKEEVLQVINLEDTGNTLQLHLEGVKTAYLFCNNDGIFLITYSLILHYDYIDLMRNDKIIMEKKLTFMPNSLSSTCENIAVVTNGRKIVLLNLLDGKLLFENKGTALMPYLRVHAYKDHIFAVNVIHIFVFSIKTGHELMFNCTPAPTCCFAVADSLIVGDSEGFLRVFNFSGDILSPVWKVRETKSNSLISLADSADTCVLSLGLYDDSIVCFTANEVSLWSLKVGLSLLHSIQIEGKVLSFRAFKSSIQLLVNDDELWIWTPTTKRVSHSTPSEKSKKFALKYSHSGSTPEKHTGTSRKMMSPRFLTIDDRNTTPKKSRIFHGEPNNSTQTNKSLKKSISAIIPPPEKKSPKRNLSSGSRSDIKSVKVKSEPPKEPLLSWDQFFKEEAITMEIKSLKVKSEPPKEPLISWDQYFKEEAIMTEIKCVKVKSEPLKEPLISWDQFCKEEAIMLDESTPKRGRQLNVSEWESQLVTPDKASKVKDQSGRGPRRKTITGPHKRLKQFRQTPVTPPITLQYTDGTVFHYDDVHIEPLVFPLPSSPSGSGNKTPKDKPLSPHKTKKLVNSLNTEYTKSEKKNQI